MSELRIPLPMAEEQLAERIEMGRRLRERIQAGPRRLSNKAAEDLLVLCQHWHEFNVTWIEANLKGQVRGEFVIQTGDYSYASYEAYHSATKIRDRITREITRLESIHDRLPLWVPRPSPGQSVSRGSQAARDAPIFIVHGTDTLRAESVAHTVTTATGRKTIILREQANLGRTLIEKFEQHAAEASYAIIVLTADDMGSRADEVETRPRGRQNVIFEMGYFYGLLGRDRVSVLLRPGVEKPSDVDGLAYIKFDDDGAWKAQLLRELHHGGFDIDS